MKKLLLATSVSALLGLSSVAQAHEYYVFGGVGESDIETNISAGSGVNIDDTDTAFKLGVGYRFSEHFAAELGYVDLGEATVSTTSANNISIGGTTASLNGSIENDVDGFIVGLRGDIPVYDSVNLFARAGIYVWDADASNSGTLTVGGNPVSVEDDDGEDLYFGLGAEYMFSDHFGASIEYTRYDLDIGDADVFSAGLRYFF